MSPAHMAAVKDEEALGAAMASLGLESAMKPLSAYIKSLEQRLKECEQKAAAAKAALYQRNRAHEQDPSCAIFWTSRGYATPPWRWPSFTPGDIYEDLHLLNCACNWPTFLRILRDFEVPTFKDDCKYKSMIQSEHQRAVLARALEEYFRKHMSAAFYCPVGGHDGNGAQLSMMTDILNLRADASLFDHLEHCS